MIGQKFGYSKNIAVELNQVHAVMSAAYDVDAYKGDVTKAKEMEAILRAIKKTKIVSEENPNNLESEFDKQCYIIAQQAMETLKLASGSDKLPAKKLFSTTHSRGYELGKSMQVDDIVEAELASVLGAIQNLASTKDSISLEGVDIINNYSTGRLKGNLAEEVQQLTRSVTKDTVANVINRIQNTQFQKKAYKNVAAKLKDTQAKSIKTDIQSFNIELTAELKPEWQQIASVFSNANFTIKNYISKRKGGIAVQIHFGESNPYKSIMAQLGHLGYSFKQSQHIFFHSLNSWLKRETKAVQIHIPHLRFAYELEGNGLYDSDGMSISGADFLIVNDPISENIYVRSTKQMIANALKSQLQSSAPFTSSQYILYSDLINS